MSAPTFLDSSALVTTGDEPRLQLETGAGATPNGFVDHPTFFSGLVAEPEVVAAGVLTVADVAATRYYDLSAIRASLDPVVTASGDRLRFESFSACNGVYARFDLLTEGVASGEIAFGTTNVDVNPPLRTALAGMARTDLMHLGVGPDELRMSTPTATTRERKVELPGRWVRGFAEVPSIAAGMRPVAEVGPAPTMSFLASLSRTAPGPTVSIHVGPRGLRMTAPDPNRPRLAGTARLGALRRIARHVRTLAIYRHPSGASGWVTELSGARLTLIVSPDASRGFSGEGQLLATLADAVDTDGAAVHEHLAWQPRIDRVELAAMTQLPLARVDAAIAVLAASGKVGFDLSEQGFFHRELPLDDEAVQRDHPRLHRARDLVDRALVQAEGARWKVGDEGHVHWVTLRDGSPRCTCRWFSKYAGDRGPCAHVLAVLMVDPTR